MKTKCKKCGEEIDLITKEAYHKLGIGVLCPFHFVGRKYKEEEGKK